MSQVSRRLVSQKVQDRIFKLFLSSLVACNSNDLATSLIEDLLTPTERIMLSKRFSIAFMLLEGFDYVTIGSTLKVSSATIRTVALWLKERGKGFRSIISKIKRSESSKKVLEDILDTFEDLFASAPGQNWSRSKSILWQARRERQKPY